MKPDEIEGYFKKLDSTNIFKGYYVVSRDGMHVASKSFDNINTDTFSAMSAVILGAAETIFTMVKDKVKVIELKGVDNIFFVVSTDDRSLFIAVTNSKKEKEALDVLFKTFSK
ncbi:MAG: roadblock/LC7 domain-containing protein [Thermoplasmata archaeon]